MGTFTTPDLNSQPDYFAAIIDYGDGSTDTGWISGGAGSFTVSADHVYAEIGTYPISIQIIDGLTGGSAFAASTTTVTDAPLTITGGFQLSDPYDNSPNYYTLATFTDANTNAPLTDFSATINWGDGSPVIIGPGYVKETPQGTFEVAASHVYPDPWDPPTPDPNLYTVSVTVTDVDGASASTTSSVEVGDIQAEKPAGMNWSFTDANPYATTSDFVEQGQAGYASVDWGDGTSQLVALTGGPGDGSGPVSFAIQAWHVYADSMDQGGQHYTVTVSVADVDGNSLTGYEKVTVVRPPLTLYTWDAGTPPTSLSLNNVQLATFTVPDSYDGTGEFNDTINWGDGTTSAGTIEQVGGGNFAVFGSHTYATAGAYLASVEVSQGWSSMIPVTVGWLFADVGAPEITGPDVVPGNSNYDYSFTPPNGSTNVQVVAKIFPVNAPALVPEVQPLKNKPPSWFKVGFLNGELTYTVELQGKYTDKDGKTGVTEKYFVTVVSVGVKSPPEEKPFVTNVGPTVSELLRNRTVKIDIGNPSVDALAISPGNEPTELRSSGNPYTPVFPTKPDGAIRFSAGVQLGSLYGPPQSAAGIDDIVVGFMQHVTVQQFTVHFASGLSMTGSLVKATKNGVLDAADASKPWFSDYPGSDFQGGEIDQNDVDAYLESLELDDIETQFNLEEEYFNAFTSVITDADTPVMFFPVNWGLQAATSVDIKEVYTTDVVATRESDVKTGPYFQEATGQWTLDLSGKIDAAKGTWEAANMKIITVPDSWGAPQPPMKSREATAGTVMNKLGNTWTT